MKLTKRSVVILAILAIVLATVAILTHFVMPGIDQNDIVPSNSPSATSTDAGVVGVTIIAPKVEDKMNGETNG